jgi:hypothetical protein
MKNRHNKKRNTALVYESLIREATVSIIKNDTNRKNKVFEIIKKHFKQDTELFAHLQCYRSLYENQGMSKNTCEKILKEAKLSSRLIDFNGLFKQQTELINDINSELSPEVFNNFVPNYKTLATIDQIFSPKLSPQKRVMLEEKVIDEMSNLDSPIVVEDNPDDITIKFFTQKFNEKYSKVLSEEQKTLLSLYISSFADNAVELKTYLNEEVYRLKSIIGESLQDKDINNDHEMVEKTNKIVEKLESFKNTQIDENILLTILKTQELAKELNDGGNN